MSSSDAREGDMLMRTTLETDAGLSALTIAGLLSALRRVPGVLLADIADGSCRAIIAHDAAVPKASLLAAAQGAGVLARISCAKVAPVAAAAPPAALNGLLLIVAEVAMLLALLYVINPRLFGMSPVLPITLAVVWGCVLARIFFGRRA